jgi:hypothetical protein
MLLGKWDKLDREEPVDVIVRAFSHASNSRGETRPVVIVEEVETGAMRYVDLSYVKIDKEQTSAQGA